MKFRVTIIDKHGHVAHDNCEVSLDEVAKWSAHYVENIEQFRSMYVGPADEPKVSPTDKTVSARRLARLIHAINMDNEYAVGGPHEHLIGLELYGSEGTAGYLEFIEHCDPRNITNPATGRIIVRRIP